MPGGPNGQPEKPLLSAAFSLLSVPPDEWGGFVHHRLSGNLYPSQSCCSPARANYSTSDFPATVNFPRKIRREMLYIFDLGNVIDIDFNRVLGVWSDFSRVPLATLKQSFTMWRDVPAS